MVTIRNKDHALAITAVASVATLRPGMLVKLVQGDSAGAPPKAAVPTAAEQADASVPLGIVTYVQEDSQYVDMDMAVSFTDPANILTVGSDLIPLGALVTVWQGTIILGYHSSKLANGLAIGTLREPTKVAFQFANHPTFGNCALPHTYLAGQSDGRQVARGYVYRNDGPEVTLVIQNLA